MHDEGKPFQLAAFVSRHEVRWLPRYAGRSKRVFAAARSLRLPTSLLGSTYSESRTCPDRREVCTAVIAYGDSYLPQMENMSVGIAQHKRLLSVFVHLVFA